jgi:bifunctional non-homologous end joining protein LigD
MTSYATRPEHGTSRVLGGSYRRRACCQTKRDLIRHYAQSAPAMLPYLVDRAVNLNRYPGGVGTKGFWHKEAPDHAPAWLRRWDNPDADPGETRTYIVVDSAASLAWLANFGGLELHPWTSRIAR